MADGPNLNPAGGSGNINKPGSTSGAGANPSVNPDDTGVSGNPAPISIGSGYGGSDGVRLSTAAFFSANVDPASNTETPVSSGEQTGPAIPKAQLDAMLANITANITPGNITTETTGFQATTLAGLFKGSKSFNDVEDEFPLPASG